MAARSRFRLLGLSLTTAVVLSMVCAATAANADSVPAPAANTLSSDTMGLAVTDVRWAVYQTEDGKAECPQGLNDSGAREQFDTLFPDQGTPRSLVDTQLLQEGRHWFPELNTTAARFPLRQAGGKVALGLNLDGREGPNDFVSPEGVRGIDNQLYRVIGCIDEFRGPTGRFYHLINRFVTDLQANRILLEITGVGDPKNDPEVQVAIYRGRDRLLVDSTGNAFIPGTSQRIESRWGRRYIQHLQGRIADGVLITEPADIVLPRTIYESTPGELELKAARFSLKLSAGGAEGLLGGYADIRKWYAHFMQSSYGQFLYPSMFDALQRLADAYPDAQLGENTAISVGKAVRFVRVNIVHDAPASEPRASRAQQVSSARTRCDESLKTSFKPDELTTVRAVRLFKAGQDLNLSGRESGIKARNDLCMVKLNVGPGNPGPADAPSTSQGIGIEIWLPTAERWNRRLRALGGGGWGGKVEVSSLTEIDGTREHFGGVSSANIADGEGAVSAVTDGGHVGGPSFAMLPDGTINKRLWADFAGRAVHEMALKSKALILAFYGEPQRFAYFDGVSTGGREAFALAQQYPDDFDGILAGFAPVYWTRVLTGPLLHPRVVVQEDLGGKYMSDEQMLLVSSAATSACDATVVPGHHDGFISDPAACRYDPTKDRSVLCRDSGGDNATAACVSTTQARAINKMWFGQTRDGDVPDPAGNNGFNARLAEDQLWYGVSRGIDITKTGGEKLFTANGIWQATLSLQSPRLGDPRFINASGNGTNGWKSLTYAELSRAQSEGLRLQREFAGINAENPDLSRFAASNGKIIYIHGMADAFWVVQGGNHYYTAVAGKMGGFARVQEFFRYYPIPGGSHEKVPGPVAGIAGVSPAPDPPLPDWQKLYELLQLWVEKEQTPTTIVARNSNGTLNRPLCMYPQTIRYEGGKIEEASSYRCQ